MKKTAYFVDDERSVLDGLRRMLRDLRRDWDMRFFTDARLALRDMADAPPDVVVSDMRMPGMDGADFLAAVHARYPSTIRLVLSGHAEFDALSRVMRSAHQLMSKPCDVSLLRSVLANAGELCGQLTDPTIAEAVAGVGPLPAIPSVLQELTEALANPDVDQGVVGQMIASDPALTVRVLQVANSSFFGARSRIETVGQAVVLLGAELLRNLVMQVKIVEAFPVAAPSFSVERFAERAFDIASVARGLAPQGVGAEDLRAMAILCDVGQLVLASRLPERYEQVLQEQRATGDGITAVEVRQLGISHDDVGAYLLALWGQDASSVGCARNHHRPFRDGACDPLLTALHVAECLVDAGGCEDRFRRSLQPELLADEPRVREWLQHGAAAANGSTAAT